MLTTKTSPSDAPLFRPGLWACIAFCVASIVLVLVLSPYFWYMNRRADRGEIVLEDEEDREVRIFVS
jgi:hypothetical protein